MGVQLSALGSCELHGHLNRRRSTLHRRRWYASHSALGYQSGCLTKLVRLDYVVGAPKLICALESSSADGMAYAIELRVHLSLASDAGVVAT